MSTESYRSRTGEDEGAMNRTGEDEGAMNVLWQLEQHPTYDLELYQIEQHPVYALETNKTSHLHMMDKRSLIYTMTM